VSAILRGSVTLRLNFRLKGYVLPNIYGPLDRGMVMLLEVFTQRNFVADFIRLKLKLNYFFQKNKNRFLATLSVETL